MKNFILVLLFGFSLSLRCSNIYAQHLGKHVGLKSAKYITTDISKPSKLLDGEKPKAKWIWEKDNPNPLNYYLLIRKEIILDKIPGKISAYISAYSFADVYINGQLLDRYPVNCDPEFQVYEKVNLTKYFKQGVNIISAVVYNYGIGMHHRINARGGFFFQGKVEFKDAKPGMILSDKTWKVFHPGAWTGSGQMRTGIGEDRPNLIGFNEIFDASLMSYKWKETKFDETGWAAAYEIGTPPIAPWNNIVVVKRPPLHRTIALPVKMWKVKNTIIYDFGREVTASPGFEIEASKAGIVLEMGTGERLNSDSTVNDTKRVNYTDSYITKQGVQTWSPLTWRGFRYFSISQNDSVKIKNICAEIRGYDLSDKGSFECSDTLLNKIWEIGKNTIKLCAQDTYMDTPWREQTQYIGGDSRFLQKYAFYAFGGSSNFLTKYNILCGAQSQRWSHEGAIRSRYPTDWLLGPNTSAYLPDYELEWIIMLGENYKYFGDEDLVKRVYPNMKKLLDYIEKFVSPEHGLIKNAPGWIVLDHPRNFPIELKEEITALNCLYYEALQQASELSRYVLNDREDPKKWKRQADNLKLNIQKWLWSDEKKLFRDSFGSDKFSPQTQVYALLYDLVENPAKDKLTGYIVSKEKSSEQSFAYYVLYSVFNKEPGWALDYIRKYWGEQMKSPFFNGAWHEGWDVAAWKGDVGSTSHAWCSGPTALLPQKVLGAEPLEAGWKSFRVKPNPGNLTWAKGTIPSPKGNININWKKQPGVFSMDISIPKNSKGVVYIPSSVNSTITINGKSGLSTAKRYFIKSFTGYTELKLEGGNYSIVSIQAEK